MFRRQSSYPPELRERARELRRAGLSYSEVNKELGNHIPPTTLRSWIADIELTTEQQKAIARRAYPHSPETRERAREFRSAGLTYSEIVSELGGDIPQATVSTWVSDIELSPLQQERIKQKEREGSARGGILGGLWNRQQKQGRVEAAKQEASPHIKRLAIDREALQLLAAGLYIGEGAKSEGTLSFSNSDPKVVKTWIALLRKTFEIDESKLRCQLAISEGMDEKALQKYWSTITNVPIEQFNASSIKQNPGEKRREGYKGVCSVIYYSFAIRRYLDALAQGVMDEILQDSHNTE